MDQDKAHFPSTEGKITAKRKERDGDLEADEEGKRRRLTRSVLGKEADEKGKKRKGGPFGN